MMFVWSLSLLLLILFHVCFLFFLLLVLLVSPLLLFLANARRSGQETIRPPLSIKMVDTLCHTCSHFFQQVTHQVFFTVMCPNPTTAYNDRRGNRYLSLFFSKLAVHCARSFHTYGQRSIFSVPFNTGSLCFARYLICRRTEHARGRKAEGKVSPLLRVVVPPATY